MALKENKMKDDGKFGQKVPRIPNKGT